MNAADPEGPGFALLAVDGQLSYHEFTADSEPWEQIKKHVPMLGSQGMGRLRAWYVDDFAGQERNRLADEVLQAVGYHHPTGWCGPVVLTMEEQYGEYDPLPPEVVSTLDEIAAKARR